MSKTFLMIVLALGLSGCSSDDGARKPPAEYGQTPQRAYAAKVEGNQFIHLRHAVSSESFAGYYAVDGRFVPQAMDAINHVMRDQRSNEVAQIDPALLNFLVDIRRTLALPDDQPIMVLSAYRARANAGVAEGGSRVNYHQLGQAIDFQIAGHNSRTVAGVANTLQRGGVGYYPRTDHVHIDVGEPRYFEGK